MVLADRDPTSGPCASAIDRHVDRIFDSLRNDLNTRTSVWETTDSRDRQMYAHGNNRRSGLAPVTVALFVAIAGQAVVLFDDFGPGNNSQARASASMITAAAVSRAGAIEIPSQPPARQPVSSTWLASTLLSANSRS
jgi:hypothetical protein